MAHYPTKHSARRKLVLPTYRHLINAQKRIARRCPDINNDTKKGHSKNWMRFLLTSRIQDSYVQRFDAYWARYFAIHPDQWDDLDSDYDYPEQDDYCDTCGNTGYLNCYCGGDLCVCDTPEPECPDCGY